MSLDHLIPRGQTVNRPRGRLVRITLNEVQSEGLREMARHGILGTKASEVARFLLMAGLLDHAWCAYPHIDGSEKQREAARSRMTDFPLNDLSLADVDQYCRCGNHVPRHWHSPYCSIDCRLHFGPPDRPAVPKIIRDLEAPPSGFSDDPRAERDLGSPRQSIGRWP